MKVLGGGSLRTYRFACEEAEQLVFVVALAGDDEVGARLEQSAPR
jgi:hypothetical protein